MAEYGPLSRPPSQCLTREEMMAYLSGALSPVELHALEVHLSDCPFCSDALEGVESMENPSMFEDADHELKLQLEDLTQNGKTATVRVLFPWRIAAAFALLLASLATLWLAIPEQNDSIAISEVFEPYPAPAPEPTPLEAKETGQNDPEKKVVINEYSSGADILNSPSVSESLEDVATPGSSQNEQKPKQEREEKTAPGAVSSDDMAFSDNNTTQVRSGQTVDSEMNAVVLLQETVEAQKRSSSRKATSESVSKKEAVQAAEAIAETEGMVLIHDNRFKDAMAHYNKGEYQQALNLLNQLPGTPVTGFYAGICSYSLGKHRDAQRHFESTIRSEDPSFMEAAHWYLALCLVQQQKNKDARRHLQKVVLFKGEFKSKAEKLLEEL